MHPYATVNVNALNSAMNDLKGETFKLWMYLNKNQERYQFELSQKECEKWGIKKDAYYSGVNKLIELGYLRQVNEGSNIFVFFETPNSENPKGLLINGSENPKKFYGKTVEDFPKNRKSSTENPQRNNTEQTNIIQYNAQVETKSQEKKDFAHVSYFESVFLVETQDDLLEFIANEKGQNFLTARVREQIKQMKITPRQCAQTFYYLDKKVMRGGFCRSCEPTLTLCFQESNVAMAQAYYDDIERDRRNFEMSTNDISQRVVL